MILKGVLDKISMVFFIISCTVSSIYSITARVIFIVLLLVMICLRVYFIIYKTKRDKLLKRSDELREAILRRDLEKILSLIKGRNINDFYFHPFHPLHFAVTCGYLKTVEIFIDHGVNLNKRIFYKKEKYWISSLYLAIMSRNHKIVKALLDKGVELCDKEDRDPIFPVIERGNFKTVEIIVDHVVNINKPNSIGKTPLILAAEMGYFKIVKILVDKKADINKSGADSRTPLHCAAENGHFKIVEFLITRNKIHVNKTDSLYRRTALHFAALNGHLQVAKILVEKGGMVNKGDRYRRTPLQLSAINGHLDVVNMLIKHGSSITHEQVRILLKSKRFNLLELDKKNY